MFISIAQAAVLLNKSYGTARDQLSRAGAVDLRGKRPRVKVEKLEDVFDVEVPQAMYARATPDDVLPFRDIIKGLPFFGGMVKTATQLRACITYGSYYVRHSNHCNRYRMCDFTDPDSWAGKQEKAAMVKYSKQGNKRAGTIAEVLREDRLGIKRGLGIITSKAFNEFKTKLKKRQRSAA